MAHSTGITLPAARRARRSLTSRRDVDELGDKENATIDMGRVHGATRKKSRSKSIGPGGLSALKIGSGNRRASLAVLPQAPRSILKPTMSALPDIPPAKLSTSLLAIGQTLQRRAKTPSPPHGEPASATVALKSEEEQQQAAREREERDRRDARRKSLANRRVSFAAEATLHTFHEIEDNQDSTTTTNSSRRASSIVGNPPSAVPEQPPPQAQLNPESLQAEGGDRRRRSSLVRSMQFGSAEELTTTSTIYSSDSEPADGVEEVVAEEADSADSDSDDGTMMTVDDVTGTSIGSARSGASDDGSSSIDEVLRLAAQTAGMQSLKDDDADELGSDGEEVIPAFGWIKKGGNSTAASGAATSVPSTHSPSNNGSRPPSAKETRKTWNSTRSLVNNDIVNEDTYHFDDEDMSMEVTQALGGILQPGNRNEPFAESNDVTSHSDTTMDLTTAIGTIRQQQTDVALNESDDENMSMELTTVLGGVVRKQQEQPSTLADVEDNIEQSMVDEDDIAMDMTIAVGQILRAGGASDQLDVTDEDRTMEMDMTTAIGGIIDHNIVPLEIVGKEADTSIEEQANPQNVTTKITPRRSPSKAKSASAKISQPSSTKSPQPSVFRGKGLRRSEATSAISSLSHSVSRTPSPSKTPTQQRRSTRSAPSSKSRQNTTAPASPRNNSTAPTTPAIPTPEPNVLSHQGSVTRTKTPILSLTPKRREPSGVGVDREGLGSPRVTVLCDRRVSIGDSAKKFVPGKRIVAFEDPKKLAIEVEQDRQLEDEKENARHILEREVDGSQDEKEVTLNLREMIESLSPKRRPLKGRKSLHVGSARGVLGKRPLELDGNEELEENDGIKRLRGLQASPVKNIKLQQPRKSEVGKRIIRSPHAGVEGNTTLLTPSFSSPLKQTAATTPRNQGRFKDIKDNHTVHEVKFHSSQPSNPDQLEKEADQESVHLQDFLNMTSIRFMELNTTKRRHTVAPAAFQSVNEAEKSVSLSLDKCVVAGACTVPMLELYQHSCRELKKYISEGRRMVKEIELDTYEDNPPLFREYMAASSDVKALMDNQFKNVKTHARLLSKAMWYEWRMKLQDGLKEGLVRISEGMSDDDRALQQQQDLLDSAMPRAVTQYQAMEKESEDLEEAAQELADGDPGELQATREEVIELSTDIAAKKAMIATLRQQLCESEDSVEELSTLKENYLADITDSEKIREECRGWTSTEVTELKDGVDALENAYGWRITGICGTTVSASYKSEIELVLDISSFQDSRPGTQIDLWYIADARQAGAVPKTAEKEFVLQCIRDHIRALPPGSIRISRLLTLVQDAWERANALSGHIHQVNLTFPTNVAKTSDASIAVTSSMLLVPLETRVVITMNLHDRSSGDGIEVGVTPDVKIVYGEHFNVDKINEFLTTRIGKALSADGERWSAVLVELYDRLIARGRK